MIGIGSTAAAVTRRLRAMCIRDKPIAPRSPWQNGFAERLIGSIRRECVDHIVVLGEAHLRRILTKYATYYNELRTSSVSWQRRSDLSRYPARRLHRIKVGRRWPSPPLLSNLVFGTDSGLDRKIHSRIKPRQTRPGSFSKRLYAAETRSGHRLYIGNRRRRLWRAETRCVQATKMGPSTNGNCTTAPIGRIP